MLPKDTLKALAFSQVALGDSGIYYCVIKNVKAIDTSEACTLSVVGKGLSPQITSLLPANVQKSAGDSAVFTVAATGAAPLNYLWKKSNGSSVGDSSSVLKLKNLAVGDSGIYSVKVWNTYDSVVKTCTLSIAAAAQKFTLAITADSGTVINSNQKSSYVAGDTLTLKARPITGFYFAGWAGDTSATDSVMKLTIKKNRIITASFVRTGSLALNSATTGTGSGTVSKNPDKSSYLYGDTVRLIATPSNSSAFNGWTGDTVNSASSIKIAMRATKNITASFPLKTYLLTVNSGSGGSTNPSNGIATTVNHGASTQIVATPNSGFSFSKWTIPSGSATLGDSLNKTTSVVVTSGNATVAAVFTSVRYHVTLNGLNGSVATNPAGTDFDSGTVVTLTASPNIGYSFTSWTGSAQGTNAVTHIIMTSAQTVIANFSIKKYSVTANISADVGSFTGSVLRNPDATSYDSNSVVTLTAPVDNRYTFTGWSGSGTSGTQNPLDVTMNASKTITATYTLKKYALTLTSSPAAGGSLSPTPAASTYNHGSSVTINASANMGYHFSAWSGDATGTTSPTSVVMDGAKSVTAIFALDAPSITAHPLSQTVLSAGQFAKTFNTHPATYGTVSISSFWLDTVEVSQQNFQSVMGFNPSTVVNTTYPVNMVTWFDAALYCNARSKANGLDTFYAYASKTMTGNTCANLLGLQIRYGVRAFRLPSEAQWEFACRAGSRTTYWWGNDTVGMGSRAWFYVDGFGAARFGSVGTKLPNAWGLYDMVGNVMERCNDWYGDYVTTSPLTDPEGPASGSSKICRGGAAIESANEFYTPFVYSQSASRYMDWHWGDTSFASVFGIRCGLSK